MTTTDKTPMLKAAIEATSQAIKEALDGPSVATGRPPRVDGEDIVIRDLRRQLVAARQETARVRSQLAEAREALARVAATLGWDVRPEQVPSGIPDLAIAVQDLRHERDQARAVLAEAREQRDQAAEALVRAETERDDALQERDRWQQLAEERAQNLHATLRRAFAAEDVALAARRESEALRIELDEARAEIACLERDAHEQGADLWTAEDWVDWLRKRVRLAMDLLSRVLATTAPETAPESPQTGEQTQVRTDTHTKAETGSQEPLDLDAIHAAWLRVCGPCDAGYPTACTCPGDPRTVIAALAAEIDRLRAERDALRAEVERAREIAHSYRHEIGAAQVFDVLEAALGSTPDTGSTT